MKHSLYILLAGLLFMTACDKKDGLTYAERKAVGQYKFEKVVVYDDFLGSKNITQDYNNMILQLNDKKEAALIDQNNSITYFGKYDVITQTGTTYVDDDGSSSTTTEHTIIIDIKASGRGGNAWHWVGENASFGDKKMRFSARKTDGRHQFRLDKI